MNFSYSIEGGWENRFGGNDNDASVWATRKLRDAKGDHVDLLKSGDEVGTESGKVKGQLMNNKVLTLTWDGGDEVTFLAPQKCLSFKQPITSLSVSAGGLGLITSDKKALIFDAQSGEVRREFTEHVGEIYCGSLFPSGIVGLTSGADMQIKIWSATDGKCPVTLKGHTKAVNDTDLIEKGRNIISCSKDGCLKVWNCASSSCTLSTDIGGTLNSCCVVDLNKANESVHTDNKEALEHKLGVVGSEHGEVVFVQLSSNQILQRYTCNSAVNKVIPSINHNSVLVGCENGEVLELDVKNPVSLINSIHASNSPVISLLSLGEGKILCGRQDGTCTLYNTRSSHQIVLSGPDYERITGISRDDEYIYTGSRDGVVRKYKVVNLLSDIRQNGK